MINSMGVTRTSAWRTSFADAVRSATTRLGAATFNPSVRRLGDVLVIAARAADSAAGEVTSRVLILDGETGASRGPEIDLTALGAEHGIERVADPKLFSYAEGVWATFNTGYQEDGNAIYIVPVYPEVGKPVRCETPDRQRIEKNWAFFEGDGGALQAVYGLEPLIVLDFGLPGADASALMGELVAREENAPAAGLTIGTQPAMLDGDLVLVAHQRVGISKFRGYLGRPVRIGVRDGRWRARVGRARLIHSIGTLFGSWPRRNRHLWFATYFSGLDVRDGRALLTYGINDARSGVVEFDARRLWG